MQSFENFNTIISVLGILSAVFSISVIIYAVKKKNALNISDKEKILVKNIPILVFFSTLGGVIGSLLYSDLFGLLPCNLCWLERIALYPQPFIIGLSIFWKDTKNALRYAEALSLVGGLIALYHHYIRIAGNSSLPCGLGGGAGDCAIRYVFEFGFVTIPLLAFFTFLFSFAMAFVFRKLS